MIIFNWGNKKEGGIGKQATSSNFTARSQKILFMLTIQQIDINILFRVLQKTNGRFTPRDG